MKRFGLILLILCSFELFGRELPSQLSFSYINNSEFQLTAATIISLAYCRLGIKVNLQGVPSKRGLLLSNSGQLDGEVIRVAAIDQQYPNLMAVPVRLFEMQGVAFTHNGATNFDDINAILRYRVALENGIFWEDDFAKGPLLQLTRVDSIEKQFKLLKMGRVDYILASRTSAEHVISHKFSDFNIVAVEPEINNTYLFHYLNKKHQWLIPLVEQQLEKMRKSGELERIWRKNQY